MYLSLQLFLYSFVNTGGGGLLTSRSIKMGPNHILVMVRIEGAYKLVVDVQWLAWHGVGSSFNVEDSF
jgi:hypothetical protein